MTLNRQQFFCKNNLQLRNVLLFLTLVFACGWLKPAYTADFEPLDEMALMSLKKHSKAMQQLAPQLRVQLRSVRMNMKFDVREIHNIERSIGKALSDVERMLAMHNTDRVNSIRARFLVDDLRRKAAALTQGLAHVTLRVAKKYGVTDQQAINDIQLSEEDAQLLSLLRDYSQLVNQSLQLVSGMVEDESLQPIQ
ncbi:MAG: hypothetical protein B6D77_05925 [gamma proteobacterium symbiont of Ctena orbiculata]|nr:MAG: hypothetical protein B6D77_05925 [gamma proteobacterium symbiont of Ctena orbiculata]PVV21413.1 MAG: hypothetical protein B6D78_07710 [gamma proteobacterium symbiont of Ctena orbiculata]